MLALQTDTTALSGLAWVLVPMVCFMVVLLAVAVVAVLIARSSARKRIHADEPIADAPPPDPSTASRHDPNP